MPIEGAAILNRRMNDTTDTLVQLEPGGDAANIDDFLLIDQELMQVIEVINPLNYTVLRAVQGTTIATHNNNVLVRIGTIAPVPPDPTEPTQDLTNLEIVKAYLEIPPENTTDDALLQGLITAASNYWLLRTCRDSLNSAIDYSETYDGTGGLRLPLRNYPIVSVSSVSVSGAAFAGSDGTTAGWVIDQSRKGLVIVGMTSSYPYYGFPYSGYACVSNYERIATQDVDDFVRNLVTVKDNTYTYILGVNGSGFALGVQNIQVDYTAGYDSTPADIVAAVTKQVAINYKRRGWVDQKSIILPQGGGTTTYRDWELPPDIEHIIQLYTRTGDRQV